MLKSQSKNQQRKRLSKSPRKSQSRKPLKRSLIKKCDVLFSKVVRSIGQCEKCGKKENLQCAHIISRTYYHTRWDLENAVCLCLSCHLYWAHKNPHEFVRWFDTKYGGELYDTLRTRSQQIGKIDYEEVLEGLKRLDLKENETYA